jgi:hypothetical protein
MKSEHGTTDHSVLAPGLTLPQMSALSALPAALKITINSPPPDLIILQRNLRI